MTTEVKNRIATELKEKTGILDLNSCGLEHIPEEISAMTWLTKLDLSNNQIKNIQGIYSLINLTNLRLYNNQIKNIQGIDKLVNLTNLSLYNNQINTIQGIDKLINLTFLLLANNQIKSIQGIDKLINLTSLYISNNQIKSIQGIDTLVNLTSLSLYNNQINTIQGIDKLQQLTRLFLSDNQIKSIQGIDKLQQLTVLNLSNNQIKSIQGIDKLQQLTSLNLSNNQIKSIQGIDKLVNLTSLHLDNNQIRSFQGIDSLSALVALYLNDNPISHINSNQLAFLSQLTFLDLGGTKIKSLSLLFKDIKKGKKILWEDVKVEIFNAPNQEEYFEFTIYNFPYHIKKGINVKGCKELDAGLVAAIKSGHEALLAYINEPKEPLLEARVLVLGEPRAGKTTLRRKLLNVNSAMPTTQESTKAFEIEITPYSCEVELKEQQTQLQYHLWDFGGQDYYRLLHQLFIAEQSVYVIVVDTDKNRNEEEMEFWLDTIERLGKADGEEQKYGPVILFQNPKNNRSGSDFTDLRRRYPFWQQTEDFVINLNALNEQVEDSFEAKELSKFNAFKKYLGRSFCQLDHIGKEIPSKWVAVRQALIEEQTNWISVERFHTICKQKEIESKGLRNDLLDIFRRLGFLLHYKNTALKGMVILNKEWVTDALYRVLDDETVSQNRGWFRKEDAENIWYEEQYENRTEELLALMQEFKFCYLNNITKKYIVPSQLPSTPPDRLQWDSTNNVRLHLKYDWMPKAVAIQLMVSLHEYIVAFEDGEQWIWRKGAVLDGKKLGLNNVQVRIRDEYKNRRIAIEAKGAHSEMLFRVIMKSWQEVNEPFKDKVKVTPIILCPCAECIDSDSPHKFRYQKVLEAKERNKPLQCNESFEPLDAAAILKGVYDETTVLLDTLKHNKQGHAKALDLIRKDKLKEAIALVTSEEENVMFHQQLSQWNKLDQHDTSSVEEKNRFRTQLANRLVNYFKSDNPIERQKLRQLKE